ncbi:MAG: nucleotidyltransferase domain-containing protein [Planctomycetota bacterium]|nr:nucleotidyltransferase domain-containing protein [Planctomycetota bacterium]
MNIDPRIDEIVAAQPCPHLFVTISGAHLYGFPSPDSDYDIRGVHILPAAEVVGLVTGPETLDISDSVQGLELDLVTHDIKRFFSLLLRRNGYVLEQLYSPLIVETTPEHQELKDIARGCITRNHVHHYSSFAKNQWKLFRRDDPPKIKPLLYTYRVLLTGIHLMQTGRIEANLLRLNDEFRLPQIDELVSEKLEGGERCSLRDTDLTVHRKQYEGLLDRLRQAHEDCTLIEAPTCRDALNKLLVRLRIESVEG